MIYFATSSEFASLTPDDRLAVEALRARGHAVIALDWRSSVHRPGAGDLVVIRSCWDYHLAPTEFSDWLQRLQDNHVTLANGYQAVRGNMHKAYLLDLAARGLASIPPTRLLVEKSGPSLAQLRRLLDAERLVIKPAVSLSAHNTWRTNIQLDADAEARFRHQLADGDLLVQAYIEDIEHTGELSLVFLNGVYSHAMRKRPRPGDFRVQKDFGGMHQPVQAPGPAIALAKALLATVAADSCYARVDLVESAGRWLLMELELIDPVLFLGFSVGATERLAEAVINAQPQSRKTANRHLLPA